MKGLDLYRVIQESRSEIDIDMDTITLLKQEINEFKTLNESKLSDFVSKAEKSLKSPKNQFSDI